MTPDRALIVDYGGVLTEPTVAATRRWCADVGITYRQFVGPLISGTVDAPSLIHRLETGAMPVEEFERALGAAITSTSGVTVDAVGFTRDVVGSAAIDPAMLELLDDARAQGVRTALLSNSWGAHYPHEVLDPHLDVWVVSGEEGLRKPDPAIYRLASERVGVAPSGCVFVDDLRANVAAAEAVGMTGVLHVDAPSTRRTVLAALVSTDV